MEIKLKQQLQFHGKIIHSAVSSDEAFVLAQNEKGDIAIWRVQDGERVFVRANASSVPAVLGSSDRGPFVATGTNNQMTLAWFTETNHRFVLNSRHIMTQIMTHPRWSYVITVSPTTQYDESKRRYQLPVIQFWDLPSGSEGATIELPELARSGPLHTIKAAYSPTGSELALLVNYERNDFDRCAIVICPLRDGRRPEQIKLYLAHSGPLQSAGRQIAWRSDANVLACSLRHGTDRVVFLDWQARGCFGALQTLFGIRAFIDPVMIEFPPPPHSDVSDHDLFSSAQNERRGWRYQPSYGFLVDQGMESDQFALLSHHFTVVLDRNLGKAVIFHGQSNQGVLPNSVSSPTYLASHQQNSMLAVGYDDGALRWYTPPTFGVIAEARLHKGEITSLTSAADGRLLVSGCGQGMICLWE